MTEMPSLNGTRSLQLLRFDRANIETVSGSLCEFCPDLKSL